MNTNNENCPIRVFTLGRFAIVRDGIPIHFTGKVQRKPLELLKAIISSGGRHAHTEPVMNLIWPDAEGDMAHQSFDTTLHRLRRLIGNDMAIKLHGGQLTLDERSFWIDIEAFERMDEKIEALFKSGGVTRQGRNGEISDVVCPDASPHILSVSRAEVVRLLREIFGLYKGSFLPAETKHFWTISTRERLRNKFIRFIIMLGNCLEQLNQWQAAAEHYRTAIEIDGFTEEFYQRLMVCHHQLDQCAKAIEVYQRLTNTFSTQFGIRPSKTTEALYKALITENR